MADDKYSGYDDLVRSLAHGQRENMAATGHRRTRPGEEDEIEMFVTSEDRAKEAKLRELEGRDPRDRRSTLGQQPEESVYFRYSDRTRVQRYTDEELEGFREGCRCVIVHDYSEGDFYHMSDEARARNDQLATINLKLGGLKRIYRSIDQYILAMRIVYDSWSILADGNPLHTREEFFDYVAKGIIVSNRIIAPKMRGIDKYNQDLIMTYISNPNLDPKDLLPKPIEPADDYMYASADELKFEMDCLLSPTELEYVVTYDALPPDKREVLKVRTIKRRFLKAYDDDQTLRKKKQKSKLSKVDRDLQPDLTAILKKIVRMESGSNPYGGIYSFSSLADARDRSRAESSWDKYPFQGSWQDDDAVALYELAMYEEHMRDLIPGDTSLTYGDQANNAFYKKLEENGVSTVELRRSSSSEQMKYLETRKKQSRKLNRKMETAVLSRIGKLCDTPEFKKLTKKSEKSLERYRAEKREETE